MSTLADLPAGTLWLHDETTEEFDWESTQCTAKFLVPWGARAAFLTAVGGTMQTFTIGTVSYTRVVPLAYPDYPNCYAYKLHMVGAGASDDAGGGQILYSHAIASVWFRTPPWRVDSPYPLVTFNAETNADITTRPGSAYVFPSDGLPLSQNVGVRVPVKEFSFVFHQVPSFNDTLYDSLSGCVNATTFLGKPPGTVQYIGPSTSGQVNSWNQTAWQITHRFRWRAIPHNAIMRPDGTGFEAPLSVGTDEPLLPPGELNLLWAG